MTFGVGLAGAGVEALRDDPPIFGDHATNPRVRVGGIKTALCQLQGTDHALLVKRGPIHESLFLPLLRRRSTSAANSEIS